MRLARFALLLLACVAFGAGAGPGQQAIQTLADRARSLAPEFAADALLRIVESNAVMDKDLRKELIENAFRQAAAAQQQVAHVAVTAAGEAAWVGRAANLGLDVTSLQSRAVRDMLSLDPKKGRELFGEIVPPRLERLSCDARLVFDVSSYYEALAGVAQKAFSPKEIAEEEPLKLLTRFAGNLQGPAQVAPVARMLTAIRLDSEQLATLVTAFAGALKNLTGDPRSFMAAVRQSGESSHIAALARLCTKMGIDNHALLESYRAYLVAHLHGTRCEERPGTPGSISFGLTSSVTGAPVVPVQNPAEVFNAELRPLASPGAAPNPIGADEASPTGIEPSKSAAAECSSSGCRELIDRYRKLLFGPGGMPYSNEQKNSNEWRAQLTDYLGALAAWREDSEEDGPGGFARKCQLFSSLIYLAPNGPDREQVLRAFVAFLGSSNYQREHRAEWLVPVSSLIGRVFADPLGLTEIRKELLAAENPAISLYANLEALAPRSPDRFLALM